MGTFILSFFLRKLMFPKFYSINIFLLIFFVVRIKKYISYNRLLIIITTLLSLSFIYNSVINDVRISLMIIIFCNIILPLFLIGYEIDGDKKVLIRSILKVINILVVAMFIFAIIDKIENYGLASWFWSKVDDSMLTALLEHKSSGIYRFYSFMGHPLFNTQLFLMFYILNICYSKYMEKIMPESIVTIISLVGICFTASKTGVVLIIFSILLLNNFEKKLLGYLSGVITLFIAFWGGLFNDVLFRLINGSLTSGREEVWDIYLHSGYYPIKFFVGYGPAVLGIINNLFYWGTAAFEYPFRRFSIEYGILFTILLYCLIFIYPSITLLKRRHYFLYLSYLIVFIDCNTYNGINNIGDYMLILCLFIMIILNLSKYKSSSLIR